MLYEYFITYIAKSVEGEQHIGNSINEVDYKVDSVDNYSRFESELSEELTKEKGFYDVVITNFILLRSKQELEYPDFAPQCMITLQLTKDQYLLLNTALGRAREYHEPYKETDDLYSRLTSLQQNISDQTTPQYAKITR